uniref:hypothetical protein orf130 n=1 Tax=Pterosiphonia complanata TaxID=884089 RepID=UPI0022FD8E4F|nr:hypothetical protein orf130 [Pterosiphonia complanata]WAX03080.1 hypothetical protein orf130 [Pterosiphonia complanata]
MQSNLSILLNKIKGNWSLQENFYFILNRKQKKYKEQASFLKNLKNNKFNIYNCLIENANNKKLIFKLEKVEKNLIIITNVHRNKKISSKEYIYIISNNFMISLIIIKNLTKKQYIGLKVSSYIRIIQKTL